MQKGLVEIVETSVFTKQVKASLSDEEYRALQLELAREPTAGKVIPGSGGLRILRWAADGRGKSGGYRIIYYYAARPELLLLLYVYAKNDADDLTPDQIRILRKIVMEEYK